MIITFAEDTIDRDIVFCFVDNTWQYSSGWTKQLIINQSDYTITNLVAKGYTVLQGLSEDLLLKEAAKNFKHAVVFTTGTEFINGYSFFDRVKNLIKEDYFIAGHVLDRNEAYYELHHQCYVINLLTYKDLSYPAIGKQELGSQHQQIIPLRSNENYHDDYTPVWIKKGIELKTYNHKCHGWHILSLAFSLDLSVYVFDNEFRVNKKHYYPENQKEFLNHSSWLYQRERFCSLDFVHKENTDWSNTNNNLTDIEQVVTPASGTWWREHIKTPCYVVFYDYNQSSLDYWKQNAPIIKDVTYKFIKVDLLCDSINIIEHLDVNKSTLINLSNIFAYEGTTFLTSLEKRLYQENNLLNNIKENMPAAWISFSSRSSTGFIGCNNFSKAIDIDMYSIEDLKKPSWHMNGDWND